MIHIPHKHSSKESIPSSKPTHSSHSIEEQTSITLTYKTTNNIQMQKKKNNNKLSRPQFLMMHNCFVVCQNLPSIRIKVFTSIHVHPQKILIIVLGYKTKKGKMYHFFQCFFLKKKFWLQNYFDMCFDHLIKCITSLLYSACSMISTHLYLYKNVFNGMNIHFSKEKKPLSI